MVVNKLVAGDLDIAYDMGMTSWTKHQLCSDVAQEWTMSFPEMIRFDL